MIDMLVGAQASKPRSTHQCLSCTQENWCCLISTSCTDSYLNWEKMRANLLSEWLNIFWKGRFLPVVLYPYSNKLNAWKEHEQSWDPCDPLTVFLESGQEIKKTNKQKNKELFPSLRTSYTHQFMCLHHVHVYACLWCFWRHFTWTSLKINDKCC